MNILCLFGRHSWKFAYNHGMPLGLNTKDALDMIHNNQIYGVYVCTECRKQSRIKDGKVLMLSKAEMETP